MTEKTLRELTAALLAIRGGRLYQESHKNFEDYCRVRWDWGRNYVNKQIQAAQHDADLPKTRRLEPRYGLRGRVGNAVQRRAEHRAPPSRLTIV